MNHKKRVDLGRVLKAVILFEKARVELEENWDSVGYFEGVKEGDASSVCDFDPIIEGAQIINIILERVRGRVVTRVYESRGFIGLATETTVDKEFGNDVKKNAWKFRDSLDYQEALRKLELALAACSERLRELDRERDFLTNREKAVAEGFSALRKEREAWAREKAETVLVMRSLRISQEGGRAIRAAASVDDTGDEEE